MSDFINTIVREWSYNVDDGMPNVKNPLHVIELENTLNEMEYSRTFIRELLRNLRQEAKAQVIAKTLKKAKEKADLGQTYSSPASKKVYKKGEEGDEGESKSELKPSKEGIVASNKIKEKIKKIKNPEQRKSAILAMKLVDKYNNARTNDEKRKVIQAMADSGLFAINGMGVATNKFYIDPDKTGLNRKLIGDDNKFAKEMHKAIADSGIDMPVRGSRTGQNRFGPGNLLGKVGEKGGGKPTSSSVEIEETEKGGVIVGGTEFNPTPPLTDKQKDKRREQYKNAGKTDEEVDSLIRQEESHREWNNKKIEALKNGEVEALDIKDGDGNIQDTATDEGRKGAIKAVATRINDRMKALLGDDLNKAGMRHVKLALNNFEKAAEDYANGDITAEDYQKAQEKLKVELERNPETKASMPNLEETFDAMENWSQGRHTILPSASNFPVGDIWSFDPVDLPEDATQEQIAQHINIMTSSHGLTSIKEGKGGASQSKNKISQSKYASYKKKDGTEVSSEEVSQDLVDLSSSNYEDEWNDKDPQGGIDRAERQTDELMEKYGLSDDEIGIIDTDRARWKNNAKRYAKKTAERYGISEDEAEKLLLRRYRNHDRAVSLMAHINNETVESQGFTNISHKYKTTKPNEQEVDENGAPRFEEDIDGNQILDKRGKPKPILKRKEVNDITNGSSILACMDPKKDPGFKAPYGIPNNVRASHIYSCENKHSS